MNKSAVFFALVTPCLVLVSCGVFDKGKAEGRLESSGGELGNWVITKAKCFSGQRENYFGVIAFGPADEGTSFKLIKDPVKGFSAVVNIPSTCAKQAEKSDCRALAIPSNSCDVFEAQIERTNTTVNDIRKLNATVKIDCVVGDGKLKGKLAFDGCH